MNGTIYISGEIGVNTTLLDVIKQVKAQPQAQSYLVKIDSNGGYVDAGFAIYDYLKNLGKPVTTYTTKAYSIASVIFMAGSIRIIPENTPEALMIHNPWMEVAGDQQTLAEYAKDLKKTEDELIEFYSKAVEIPGQTIQNLLKNETFLNATQAKELGFATQLQVASKAVAKLHNKDKDEKNFMSNYGKQITEIWNKVVGNPTAKNELILQDATGEVEIKFTELEPTDVAEVGAIATVNDEPANESYLMPDGQSLVFVAGELTEIIPAEETGDEPADEEEPEASAEQSHAIDFTARLDELENKLSEIINKMVENQDQVAASVKALAKSIGSDYSTKNTNEKVSAVAKAKETATPKFSIKRK